jgi:hypothetical protein
LVLCLLLPCLCLGCNPYSYVNVPAQKGDVARHDPNSKPVRQVAAAAMKAVLANHDIPRPVLVVMPAGSSELSAADVARRLGDGAVSAADTDVTPAATIHARQVRIRGMEAEVDVIFPGIGGVPQLVTVYESWAPFNDWGADRMRTWRSDENVADPNQVPLPGQVQ